MNKTMNQTIHQTIHQTINRIINRTRRPNLMKWGSNNTPPDGQMFLKLEIFLDRNPLKAKRIFEGKWIFWKLKLFTKGNTLWICHMGCCLQRENLPPTDLFTSKRFYQHKISTFRNNCPSGGVLLDPNFVKLGRRVHIVLHTVCT